ncbi:ATP-binding cassette domain-containing protein [bacterium]|nr:ATP-binding cassette domain-containing protein [bacterium]
MIIFDNVSKQYGTRKILDSISISIRPKEFVSIVGPSGAGKSTLIYTLIGAERIDNGSILVDDYKVHVMSERALQFYRRKLGIVFQDYKLLQRKNVHENIAFALEATGVHQPLIDKKVDKVLEMVGLTEVKKHFPHQLSGGEQQRVAIARALVHDPKLLIADEPTGNLDPKASNDVLNLLVKINKNGTTVLLATHNKHIVDTLKRRVIRLENGIIKSDNNKSGYDK